MKGNSINDDSSSSLFLERVVIVIAPDIKKPSRARNRNGTKCLITVELSL
jgi:hypothetical protein